MAENSRDSLTYYLSMNNEYIDCLGSIRQWDNIKLGFDENRIWIKDLNKVQTDSIVIKSIPHKKIYYVKNGKLFLKGSLLPHCNIPPLLWTPVKRALPLSLPSYNDNYFGPNGKINTGLVQCDDEKDIFALRTSCEKLRSYIESAPESRLNNLEWAIIEDTAEALIIGTPILPITGHVYLKINNFLIPAGYNLKYPILAEEIRKKIDAGNSWIIWSEDNTYCIANKNNFIPLSLSSFRKSISI